MNDELIKLQKSITPSSGRKILLLSGFPKQCMICDSFIRIECHHRDGNNRNNKINNLEFRCKACHVFIHKMGWREWKAEKIKRAIIVQSQRGNIFPKPYLFRRFPEYHKN